MKMNEIKFKRQIRDFFNKTVHDITTLKKVAEVINFKKLYGPPEQQKED